MSAQRSPLPPFTLETAVQKVRLAEDGWNSRDAEKVALAYTIDSDWRNRAEFVRGREAIVSFLKRKWQHELDYRLIKELWAFSENRIAVRFAYEWHDNSGNWFRSYGNENWEFDETGLMQRRLACINDAQIREETVASVGPRVAALTSTLDSATSAFDGLWLGTWSAPHQGWIFSDQRWFLERRATRGSVALS